MAPTYMTVGEVADLVGVTVRSIQYYDQQGILSPSAKGPQNQRFYTPQDVERLYCILSLKYAGLSLAQIRECLKDGAQVTRGQAYGLFTSALRETEAAFSSLLSRYATLRSLAEAVQPEDAVPLAGVPGFAGLGIPPAAVYSAGAQGFAVDGPAVVPAPAPAEEASCATSLNPVSADAGGVDWQALSGFTKRAGAEGRYFWHLSCIYDEGAGQEPHAGYDKARMVTEWHALIAALMNHMGTHEPLDSEHGQELVRRFMRLRVQDGRHPTAKSFLLLEGAPANHPGGSSFDGMRHQVYDHLARLLARYAELHPDEETPSIDGGSADSK